MLEPDVCLDVYQAIFAYVVGVLGRLQSNYGYSLREGVNQVLR